MKWNAVFMAVLLALGATACSKDEGSDSEGTEPESAATAAEAESADEAADEAAADEGSAEEGSGADRLVGKWVLDEEAVKAMMEEAKAEGDSKAKAAQGMGTAMLLAMKPTFEFMEGGKSKFTMHNPIKKDAEPKTEEASWEVVSEDGDSIVIKTTDSKGKTEEVTATFDGDDEVTLEKDGDEMKMHLRRAS